MRTLVGVSAAALTLAAPGYAVKKPPPDITLLVKQALVKVRAQAQFRKAILLEADGAPRTGTTTKAFAVTHWRLVFQNQATKGSTFKSAWLKVIDDKIGGVHGVKAAFLEDRNIKVVPQMTLATAVAKLRKAGRTQGFAAVTLRYPLGPGFTEPLYIFGFDSGAHWSVATKTGKVKPIR